MNQKTFKPRLSKKVLCFILSMIIALGTFITFTIGYSPLHNWLGIRNMLSAYAAEIVDTDGAVAVDEEAMLADDHTINLENKDGSNTVYLFSEPISFTDDNGDLKTKDISVEKAPYKLRKEGYDYTNGQNDYRINFSKDYTIGVEADFEGASYSIIPQSEIKVEGEEAVAEYLDENFEVFQYKNIYGNRTNLRFYPQLNGVKEEIVLNQNINKNTFEFKLNTNNCSAQLNDSGEISLLNKEGATIETFAAPFAYDSEYVEGIKDKHYSDAFYSLKACGEGEYILSITVDDEWLKSSSTVYPVIIDPTTTAHIENMYDLPIHSTRTTTGATVDNNAVGTSTQYGTSRSLVKFQKPSNIVSHARIISAYYWTRELTGRTSSFTCGIHKITSSWNENSLWSTAPSYSSSLVTSRNINGASTDYEPSPYWFKFNIKNLVQEWYNGTTNYGFMMKYENESSTTKNLRTFAQKEYSSSSWRPYTVITYTNDTTPPTVTTIPKSPANWTNQNVTFTVNAEDNESGLASKAYSFTDSDNTRSWQSSSTSPQYTTHKYISIYVRDAEGNETLRHRWTYIDKKAPSTPTVTGVSQTWTNQPVAVTVSSNDAPADSNNGESGVKYYSCTKTQGAFNWKSVEDVNTPKTFTISEYGTYYFYAKDQAGNISSSTSKTIYYDDEEPEITSVDIAPNEDNPGSYTVTIEAEDELSGIDEYSIDNGVHWNDDNTFSVPSVPNQIEVKVKDVAGNIADDIITIRPPVIYQDNECVGLINPNQTNFEMEYKINNGEYVLYSEPFEIPSNEDVIITAKIKDNSTESTKSVRYNLNNETIPYTEEKTDLTITNNDAEFDISRYYDSASNEWYFSTETAVSEVEEGYVYSVQMPDKTNEVFVRVDDNLYENQSTGDTMIIENDCYCFDFDETNYQYSVENGRLVKINDERDNEINFAYDSNNNKIIISASHGQDTHSYTIVEENGKIKSIETPIRNGNPDNNDEKYEKLVYLYSGGSLIKVSYKNDTLLFKRSDDIIIDEYTYSNSKIEKTNGCTVNYENGNYVSLTTTWREVIENEEESEQTETEPSEIDFSSDYPVYFEGTEIVHYEKNGYTIDGTAYITVKEYNTNSKLIKVTETQIANYDTENSTETYNKETIYSYFANSDTVQTETVTETKNDITNTTVNTYNSSSQLVSIDETQTKQNGAGGTDALYSRNTTYAYFANSDTVQTETVTETENGKTVTTTIIYDINSRVVSESTGDNTTSYTYDDLGNVHTETFTEGSKVTTKQYEYDDWGNVTSCETVVTDSNVLQSETNVSYVYDKLNRCKKETTSGRNIDTTVTIYGYNPLGDVIYERTGDKVLRTVLDRFGRLDQEIEPLDYSESEDGIYLDNDGYPAGNDSYSNDNVGRCCLYNPQTRLLTSEVNRLDVVTLYTYHPNSNVVETESFDIYRYEYNSDGNLKDIFVANTTLAYAHYEYQNGNNTEIHYGNGQTVYYSYDSNKNVTTQSYTGRDETTPVTQFTYTYNTDNELTSKTDCLNHRRTDYNGNAVSVYDISGNSDVLLYSYAYTEENTSTNAPATATKDYTDNIIDIEYGENINQYKLNNNDVFSVNSTYTNDLLSSTVVKNPSDNPIVSKNVTYDNDNNVTGLTVNNMSISYVYDDDKITEYHQGNDVAYYHYDNKDQLIREDINYSNYSRTITYTYDTRGNLTEKKEYPYTRNENPGTPLETNELEFEYEDELWLDEIVTTPTETILYDENGNPVNLEDCTLEWTNGRQLKSVSNGNDVILEYTYDDKGIRTSKTYQGVTTYYCTENGVITSQYQLDTSGNKENEVIFIYDNGDLVSAYYDSAMYYYITNAMDDVISIIDESGNTVVDYCYDGWGNIVDKSVNTALTTDFAAVNPMLYRSYYYDEELGVYYLQSRYYKSDWCRFINSDSPEIAKIFRDVHLSNNLYIYCFNNPVNKKDITGYAALVDDAAWAYLIYELLEAGVIAIGAALWTIAIVSILQVIVDAISNSTSTITTKEIELKDTKVKTRKKGKKEYRFCYMNKNGNKKNIGKKMTWAQAFTALGITNTTLDYTVTRSINIGKLNNNAKSARGANGNCWGIYAYSQDAAKTLAVALGYENMPRATPGGYPHYHDGSHLIHIWYGAKYKLNI